MSIKIRDVTEVVISEPKSEVKLESESELESEAKSESEAESVA